MDVTDRAIRRAVLGHQILSFFFNTSILALVINLFTSHLSLRSTSENPVHARIGAFTCFLGSTFSALRKRKGRVRLSHYSTIQRVVEGKKAEGWDDAHTLGQMQRLGMSPSPDQPVES